MSDNHVFESQVNDLQKQQVIATYVAALVAASGRPHSIKDLLDLRRDVTWALFPAPNQGHYQEWEKTRDATLSKVHE